MGSIHSKKKMGMVDVLTEKDKYKTKEIDTSKPNFLKEIYSDSDKEIKKFKRLIKKMYGGFPNWFHINEVEDIIGSKWVIDSLINNGFLIRNRLKISGNNYEDQYMLGPNGLNLINSWRIEALTMWIFILTILIVILTIINLFYKT